MGIRIMFLPYLLLVLSASVLAWYEECPEVTPAVCGEGEMKCYNGMDKNGCWKGDYCQPVGPPDSPNWCTPPCNDDLEPNECPIWDYSTGTRMTRCEYGYYYGCYAGDYCVPPEGPEETRCHPWECDEPAPAICNDTDVRCTDGMMNHCKKGDYCLPEGSTCPFTRCDTITQICLENEVSCDSGYYGHCWLGNYCMPEGSVCPTPCEEKDLPTTYCSETEVWCPPVPVQEGCWEEEKCLPAGSVCP